MPNKSLRFCAHPGCSALTDQRYCPKHAADQAEADKAKARKYESRRASAQERGYGARWQQYSKGFLKQPGNQICKLHLDGCTLVADCVDHIDPPDGPGDKRFWDRKNRQAACIHCNSVKGHRRMIGTYDMMEVIDHGTGKN